MNSKSYIIFFLDQIEHDCLVKWTSSIQSKHRQKTRIFCLRLLPQPSKKTLIKRSCLFKNKKTILSTIY